VIFSLNGPQQQQPPTDMGNMRTTRDRKRRSFEVAPNVSMLDAAVKQLIERHASDVGRFLSPAEGKAFARLLASFCISNPTIALLARRAAASESG
jgi:hypothetical protein